MNGEELCTMEALEERVFGDTAPRARRSILRRDTAGDEIEVCLSVTLSGRRLSETLDEIIIAFSRDPALAESQTRLAQTSVERWMQLYKLYRREMKRSGREEALESARLHLLEKLNREMEG